MRQLEKEGKVEAPELVRSWTRKKTLSRKRDSLEERSVKGNVSEGGRGHEIQGFPDGEDGKRRGCSHISRSGGVKER